MTAQVLYQYEGEMPRATRHVLEHGDTTYDVYIVDYELGDDGARHVVVTRAGGGRDAWEFWSSDFEAGLTDAALATAAVERVVG